MKRKDLAAFEFEQYYSTYLKVLEDDTDLHEQLKKGYANFPKFIESLPEEKLGYSYAEGKWSIAQALLHIVDSERIFQYRAFRFSRNDKTTLPGFNQDDYVLLDDPRTKSKKLIIKEYQTVRASTIALFDTISPENLQNTGIASNILWSVAGLGFVICGHQRHHRNIIRERYL